MKKLEMAVTLDIELGPNGKVYVVLKDAKERSFACFSLPNEDWIPFGEECARISRGEEPLGQPERQVLQ